MSNYNDLTLNMYRNGGAKEYINQNEIDTEEEKWVRLFNYIEDKLHGDKKKKILEFGSGSGIFAKKLQDANYDVISSDAVDTFLEQQKKIGINNVKKFDFLKDNFNKTFNNKFDLIISWRNPHLDIDDLKKLFEVVYNGLNDSGIFVINFQNVAVHPNASILDNGTNYDYKILEDKDRQTTEKRFFAYYSKEDIEQIRKNLFDVVDYHNEGGSEKKNWHVYTFKKI